MVSEEVVLAHPPSIRLLTVDWEKHWRLIEPTAVLYCTGSPFNDVTSLFTGVKHVRPFFGVPTKGPPFLGFSGSLKEWGGGVRAQPPTLGCTNMIDTACSDEGFFRRQISGLDCQQMTHLRMTSVYLALLLSF